MFIVDYLNKVFEKISSYDVEYSYNIPTGGNFSTSNLNLSIKDNELTLENNNCNIKCNLEDMRVEIDVSDIRIMDSETYITITYQTDIEEIRKDIRQYLNTGVLSKGYIVFKDKRVCIENLLDYMEECYYNNNLYFDLSRGDEFDKDTFTWNGFTTQIEED